MAMFPDRGKQKRRQARSRPCAGGWAIAIATVLYVWMIAAAMAQPPVAQSYRIGAGDKVGIVVFGQPDLSGEVTVDQVGNLRLPIIGDIRAVDLTLGELEKSIVQLLEQGYVRRAVVSARIAEFRPIHVLGMVRAPGLYPYHQGQSVLAAIARAGGIGSSDQSRMGGDLVQADERVRLLEISRVALTARRARLVALQNGDERISFPDMSALHVDPARIAQIRDGEQRAFDAERQAQQREVEALEKQIPRLRAEIASLQQQGKLELQQRDLNQQLVDDYERLSRSGLARKQTYIEIRREEARIEGNVERLKSEALRAEIAIGELQFRITEVRNNYQRRVATELRETDRLLLELTVSLPAAQRLRALRARQTGWWTGEQAQQPPTIAVIRDSSILTVKYDAAIDFVVQPGDVIQVGSLLPTALSD
jgi:polysaccharide export outer membrane protein